MSFVYRQRDWASKLWLHLYGGRSEWAVRGEEPECEDQTGQGAWQVSEDWSEGFFGITDLKDLSVITFFRTEIYVTVFCFFEKMISRVSKIRV